MFFTAGASWRTECHPGSTEAFCRSARLSVVIIFAVISRRGCFVRLARIVRVILNAEQHEMNRARRFIAGGFQCPINENADISLTEGAFAGQQNHAAPEVLKVPEHESFVDLRHSVPLIVPAIRDWSGAFNESRAG